MINLLVFRTDDLPNTVKFFENLLDLSFVEEQHGNGPVHYSVELNGCIFEIYPGNPTTNIRLGFKVQNLDKALSSLDEKIIISKTETNAVILGPENCKIELN